jgi:hypothetical protein
MGKHFDGKPGQDINTLPTLEIRLEFQLVLAMLSVFVDDEKISCRPMASYKKVCKFHNSISTIGYHISLSAGIDNLRDPCEAGENQ